MDPSDLSALTRAGNLSFPSHRSLSENFQATGGRLIRRATGHLVFYGPHRRRILATDPDGNPLHECEWTITAAGTPRLARARFRLDWGQWIGLTPSGLVNSTVLDLSRKPGWERLRADDLRRMAAQAMRVSLEEVRFFYGDEDLVIDSSGQATIRHRKDAFYILDDGTFRIPDRVRFMACMGAMHWERIDFLPVVELFQSLLPGTGSAAFELIRGLYDDQNEDLPEPLSLRYRGIPTYPSEAAFRLFSAFFVPQMAGERALDFFLDSAQAHQLTWLPTPDSPRRYFDATRNLCVTIKGDKVEKATLADDPTGLPFVASNPQGIAPYERSIRVADGRLILSDGGQQTEAPIHPIWNTGVNAQNTRPPDDKNARSSPTGWRALFGGAPPRIDPRDAFSAVLLYPEDERDIDELPTQPFVADYVQDLFEETPDFASHLSQLTDVLIDRFDAAMIACIHWDRPRTYTILYRHAAYAQKQAQALWTRLAGKDILNWVPTFQFLPYEVDAQAAYRRTYGLIYKWIPFAQFIQPGALRDIATALGKTLKPHGLAIVVGPQAMERLWRENGFRVVHAVMVEELPTFRMHQTILPRARIKAGLMVFCITKDS